MSFGFFALGTYLLIFLGASSVLLPAIWLSDLHLDVIYSPEIDESNWCREGFNDGVDLQRHQSSDPRNGLRHPVMEELRRTPESITLSAWWGRYGCDSPAQLIAHCFDSIVNVTRRSLVEAGASTLTNELPNRPIVSKPIIFMTGDFVAHYWKSRETPNKRPSLVAATKMVKHLQKTLGSVYREFHPNDSDGVQAFVSVGNNDLLVDYFITEWDGWAKELYELWSPDFIPDTKENRETFCRGLYYWAEVRGVPGLRVVSLNTLWWSQSYPWKSPRNKDPAGQFEWLAAQLRKAQESAGSVVILGHIPPGVTYFSDRAFTLDVLWHDDYQDQYLQLMAQYKDVIVSQHYGHLHADDARIFTNTPEKPAVASLLLSPSVGPSHGNNPGFRILDFRVSNSAPQNFMGRQEDGEPSSSSLESFLIPDVSNASGRTNVVLADYHQYVAHLHSRHVDDLGTYSRIVAPPFVKEYSFCEAYKQKDVSAAAMQNALSIVQNDPSEVSKFWWRFNANGNAPPAAALKCFQAISAGASLQHCLAGIAAG